MNAGISATVLVVDDNPGKRYSVARLLRAAGFEVIEGGSGQEALDQAEAGPDAIVLDVNLPDIDGYEVCRILRSRQGTARTPIIHLSATFVNPEDKVYGLEAGADGYLTHPVEPPVLVATVRAFIRARRAEDELRRSEAKFRTIFDRSLNGIALFNSSRMILEANPAMAAILGMEGESLAGLPWSRFWPPGGQAASDERFARLQAAGGWQGTAMLSRPDGGTVYVEGHVSLHAAPDTWIAVFTDASDRLAADAERERLYASERAARTEAERANRLKDDFLATVSHELRSPLQAIVGWSQLLRTRPNVDLVDYQMGIEAIHRNARLQSELITDLLDVSRITSGKLRLERRELDLAQSIAHALDSVAQPALARHLSIQTELEGDDLRIFGDPNRVQQVLVNLLTNAMKFTEVGGNIRVAAVARAAEIHVSVTDDGQGISPEFLPHLFEAFRQEDAATTRKHEGLGLGLSIVRRIVEMHGGSVSASSEGAGRGATFSLVFPSLAASRAAGEGTSGQPAVHEQEEAMEPSRLRGLRLLLVDDDADARMVVRRLLDDFAVDTVEAGSVAEAMQQVALRAPDMLVSDISMPGDDGYALVRMLREAGHDADRLPAIALTAFAQPEDKVRALAQGFQAHLGKPIDLEALLVAISGLAPRRHG
jgi:PAS domain S-box-containing protein